MASNLPVPPSGALDQPPPSPLNPPPPGGDAPPSFGGAGVPPMSPGPAQADPMKQVAQMGMEIDRALLAFSEMAPGDVPEIGQVRKLLQAALAKILSAGGGQVTGAAGSPGSQFPGVGLNSGQPF